MIYLDLEVYALNFNLIFIPLVTIITARSIYRVAQYYLFGWDKKLSKKNKKLKEKYGLFKIITMSYILDEYEKRDFKSIFYILSYHLNWIIGIIATVLSTMLENSIFLLAVGLPFLLVGNIWGVIGLWIMRHKNWSESESKRYVIVNQIMYLLLIALYVYTLVRKM